MCTARQIQGIVRYSLVAVLILVLGSLTETMAQNIFSRKSGNWDDNTVLVGTWSTTGHGGLACSCTPGAGSTVFIGNGHTVTYTSGGPAVATVSAMTVHDAGASGALVFGSGATATTLTITNDLTIGATGSLTSGATGTTAHTIILGGNLINNGTYNQTTGAATNQSITFNSAAARAIRGTGTALSFNNMNVTAGILTFGDATATSRILTIANDLTIAAPASLNSGATVAVAQRINVGGNLTNNGVLNLTANAASNHTLAFTSAVNETISGSGGTFTVNNLTLQTTASANVNVNRNILVNGVLNFAANGLLVVDGNSNITLGAAATITGFTNARYIQLDGGTGSNSNLINTTNGAASWQITYPIGTSNGGYSPIVLPTIATNPTAASTISVKAIYNNSIQGQLRRTFRIVVAGNAAGTTFSGPQFNYNTTADLSGGDALSNYNTIWHLNAGTGSWTTVTGTNAGAGTFSVTAPTHNLNTGTYYYTIGSSTAYPNTWYTYQSGVWSDWRNWTLDPSGTTLVNGLNLPPQPGDEVVILSGITITNDVSGQVASSTTINSGATLDMVATSANTLGTVSGTGLLRINGSALPIGTYTSFVTATGGTIEYYDAGATVTVASTQTTIYNNLIFSNSSTTTNATFITASNLTINGSMDILQTGVGRTVTWQINDTNNANRTMTIAGDLTVSAGGRIRVGTGNEGTVVTPQHSLTLSGNLINNGAIKFYDDADTEFSETNYSNGNVYNTILHGNAVNVTFRGATNKIITCNGQTDFYRFILNKGTGQQALLTLTSSASANMRLFGPANLNGLTPGSSNNALSIQNGTLELKGTLTIPILCTNGTGTTGNDYTIIPSSGGLWLNSPGINITVANNLNTNDDQRLLVNGLLRISSGTLTSGYGRGLGSGTGGTLMVEGGTVNTWQYRPLLGSTNVSYIQTGGEVNVGTTGNLSTEVTSGPTDTFTETYARFSVPAATSTFQMSGGELNIGTPSNNSTLAGADGIDIQSSTGNFSVTGGTIHVYVPTAGINFGINSTASFYNLVVHDEGSALTATLLQPLTILNDLTIETGNNPVFDCNNQNLTVGRNIEVQANTTLTPGTNTITLNGSAAQTWTNNGTISGLNNVVVNKSAGVVTLAGPGTTNFPSITGALVGLTLTSGTFNDGGQTVTVSGALNNSATHASTGSGSIVFSRTGTPAIGGTNGFFGNLTLTTTGNLTASTGGNQTINGNLQLNGTTTSILNIGSNNLTVLGTITTTYIPGLDATHRIQTAGFRNDGGLTRQIPAGAATDVLYPFGTAGVSAYSPATIRIASTSGGTVTIRPVTGPHPNANPTAQSVQYFWRVTNSVFTGVSAVTHKLYNYGSATLLAGATSFYRPLRYNTSTFTWTLGTLYNAAGLTIIPDFTFGLNIDGEYGTGNLTAGAVTAFYSRQSGDWNLNTTWSNTPCTGPGACGPQVGPGVFPSVNSPVVIGDVNNVHTVTMDANGRSCGSLFIAPTSILDCGVRTGLNFGVNTSGTGTLRIGTSNFPGGDFINFVGPAGGTVEWYGAYTIPSTVTSYYNLIANATGTMNMPASNLTIYNNFTKTGASTLQTNITGSRSISVNGNLAFTGGTFSFQGATVTNLTVAGATTINAGVTVNATGTTATSHTFTTAGDITNNGTLILTNAPNVVNLVFTGASNKSFTGTNAAAVTTLNNLTLNKGTSQASVLTFDVLGTTTAPATGWLTLTNGTINFSNGGTFSLSTSTTAPYSIPSTTKLKVSSGTMNIIGNVDDDDADLLLAGTLEVAGTGIVNINAEANGRDRHNDIEYASAGSPAIVVSGGLLYVNGGVRRPITTLSGALIYNQSAGIVTIGGRNCDATNTRGVFEIEGNTGSSFTMSGGTLNVRRSSGGTQFADLYVNALTSSVAATSTIQIGMPTNTAVTSPLSINVVPAIGNFSLLGTTTAQVVDMRSSELTTLGTLTVNTNATLETNALNVNIGGDLSISGTYDGIISGGNTTTFNGSGAQAGALTAGSSFQNITINKSAGVATLSGTTTINNLSILDGDLSVTNTLNINGDIINNSTQSGAGFININGLVGTTAHSITSSGGTFTNLTLGGTSTTKKVTVTGDLTINGILNFSTGGTSRYLFIQSNKLTLGVSATISNAGANRFIRTNGVSSDLGVMKNWAAGAAASFTYPVGTRTNYTPASFTLTVSAPGSLTVAPVDDQHPTANAVGQQILNYYWVVTRGTGLAYSATGSHSYQFPTGFIGGTGGTLIAAHLDALKLVGWTPSPGNGGGFTTAAPNTIMTFTNLLNTNLPGPGIIPADAQVEFHYTAGTSTTLPNPVTPVYSRIENASTVGNTAVGGDWTLASNWTTSPTGIGGTIQSVMPVGRPIVIVTGSRINMNSTGLRAFATQINGLMVIPSTTSGHNLGSMSGTGTLRTSNSTLPAGTYTTFVSAAGGTIEYVAPMNMNNLRNVYNNLSVSGTGTLNMTSIPVSLNGNLTIASGTTLNNGSTNQNISIAGNWTNNGTYTPGTGTILFTGASPTQSISGTTAFSNVTMAKSSNNVTLNAATTINGLLTLTSGNIISSAAFPVIFGASSTYAGGNATSFVSGPARSTIGAGGTFAFPVGSMLNNQFRPATIFSTSGSDTWTMQYFGKSPSVDGFSHGSHNTPTLGKVSMFEYWNIARVGATSASVTLSYNTGSYIPPNIGNLANLRVAHWDSGNNRWDLPSGGGAFSQSGTTIAGTVTVTNVTSFSPFTLGSLDLDSPLPVTWLSFTANRVEPTIVLEWKTAQERNNDHFDIERSVDGKTFDKIGSRVGVGNSNAIVKYQFIDSEVSAHEAYYYRIKQVDTDGKADYSKIIMVAGSGASKQRWIAMPNPVNDQSTFHIDLVDYSVEPDHAVKIQIVSSNGSLVYEGAGSLSDLNPELQNKLQDLGVGIYLIQISDDAAREHFRIVKY